MTRWSKIISALITKIWDTEIGICENMQMSGLQNKNFNISLSPTTYALEEINYLYIFSVPSLEQHSLAESSGEKARPNAFSSL